MVTTIVYLPDLVLVRFFFDAVLVPMGLQIETKKKRLTPTNKNNELGQQFFSLSLIQSAVILFYVCLAWTATTLY